MTVAVLDIDGTLVDTNYHHAIAWFAGAAGVFESVVELSEKLDQTPLR